MAELAVAEALRDRYSNSHTVLADIGECAATMPRIHRGESFMRRVLRASATTVVAACAVSGCASSSPPASGGVQSDIISSSDTSSFRASGNEPGWRLDITEDSMTLLLDNGQSRVAAAKPPVQMTGDRRRYVATAAGRSLTASVADSICSDTMTGMPHPNTVVVEFGDRTLRGCGGEPSALLRGPEWVVEHLDGGGVIDRSSVTIQFGDDGRISGRASCNRYFGTYALTGERLVVSQLAATKMACAPPLMTQESRFLDLLGNAQRFSLTSDGALQLHSADGGTLTARRG